MDIVRSSGNVYADLGFEDPEGMKFKARLIMLVKEAMTEQNLTESQCADVIGIQPDHFPEVLRGRFSHIPESDVCKWLEKLRTDHSSLKGQI